MIMDAMPMMEAGSVAESVSVAPPTSQAVRKYFPETWIYDCFDSGFVHLS